jgi:hypothetical protein
MGELDVKLNTQTHLWHQCQLRDVRPLALDLVNLREALQVHPGANQPPGISGARKGLSARSWG